MIPYVCPHINTFSRKAQAIYFLSCQMISVFLFQYILLSCQMGTEDGPGAMGSQSQKVMPLA
jgi:hypothetical protein